MDFGPKDHLQRISKEYDLLQTDRRFADILDGLDDVSHLRNEFVYPTMATIPAVDPQLVDINAPCIYLCGHSLGLMPKRTEHHIKAVIDAWKQLGVVAQTAGPLPGQQCELPSLARLAKLLGAKESEVCIMNGLTTNIHLLFVSFYRPSKQRHKILMENVPFPSDYYAVQSQIQFHGFTPDESLIVLMPRHGEDCLRTQDILQRVEDEGNSIAIVWISGVQYYTGQLFDMKLITETAHRKGCYVGYDLAHAVGNVPLQLHEWNVDFAVFCTYKYLNSGVGNIGGIFLHERHANNNYPRFQGWWGHQLSTRFKMDGSQDLIPGARGYALTNTSAIQAAAVNASLEVFDKTSISALRQKSLLLTAYMEMLIQHYFSAKSPHRKTKAYCEIITPENPEERGAQLSLKFSIDLHNVFQQLSKRGVVCDKRLPSVIRVAPVPLYTRFTDVYRFVWVLRESISACELIKDIGTETKSKL